MLIGICANGHSLESKTSNRFGRCDYFVIYDDVSKDKKFIENTAKEDVSGAGGRAVKLLSDEGVGIVLAPKVGPKALAALDGFEVKAYEYKDGMNVEEAIIAYLNHELPSIEKPHVKNK